MIDYERIVELGKRATKRPWGKGLHLNQYIYRNPGGQARGQSCAGFSVGSETNQQDIADADYLIAAANSADIMAQQLLDIRKLCEPDSGGGGVLLSAAMVRAILAAEARELADLIRDGKREGEGT